MLDKQYHLYSVDTGHFYSNHERYLHEMNRRYRQERNYVNNKITTIEHDLAKNGCHKDRIRNLKTKWRNNEEITFNSDLEKEYVKFLGVSKHKAEKAKESKRQILTLLSNKVKHNIETNGTDHLRSIKPETLNDTNVVSMFDSFLIRTIGIEEDELTEDLIIVQIYYFDVFKDISFFGFTFKGEKYRYYTSSAGQIRKKKAVFIKESTWQRIEKTIMCGLTIDKINAKGGNNVNKHLAYLALSNSATDEWKHFDIDRTIVIDDFETNVLGTFDFIDETDYSITRKTDYVPITHSDGIGMILPTVSKKNFMFRAPWIKGLLGVFDFRKLINEKGWSPVIKDVYGKEHDLIKERIRIIFTKSQFKMYKYYDSWDEYKECFKLYRCTAGKCNIEEDRIKNAKINYQMLQTLTDITDDEIDLLTQKSADKINDICSSKGAMMDALGINSFNRNMNPFQEAVKIYPALLNDTYAKDIIRDIKNSLLKKYRSGKLEVTGKYTFLLPDFYAACEYWFGHIENPVGLLQDHEVYCSLFRKSEKLDCLRSPHLYKEHAIRINLANPKHGERTEEISKWFTTVGIYTSTHDLISKILQFDVDGDKSLVVADPDFVRIAERNMEGIVPLYYNMRKAEPTELNPENIYHGLNAAFTGGNIGIYSNNISKIWNNEVFISGTKEEKQEAIDCVKRLCCQNNFVIDYAKTLYKPEFPKEIGKQISKYTNHKLPAFFRYAKDKEKNQVERRNDSFVNKIYYRIKDKTIKIDKSELDSIDYRKLVKDETIECDKVVSDVYDRMNKKYRYMLNMKDEYTDNLSYVANNIREEFGKTGYSESIIADMLVKYLYGNNKRYKQVLWFCYGKYIVDNLKENIGVQKAKFIQCADCGKWVEVLSRKTNRCSECQAKKDKESKLKYWNKI